MRNSTLLFLPVLLLLTLSCASGGGLGGPIDPGGPVDDRGPVISAADLAAPAPPGGIGTQSGFELSVFASGLDGPRHMARRNNEVWITERGAARIVVLRDVDRDGDGEERTVVLSSIPDVHGITYDPVTGWFFISDITTVWRFRDDNNNLVIDSNPQLIIDNLPARARHNTRTLKVSGDKLYVSVGSSCDSCIESDTLRATIQEYDLDGTGRHTFAGGLRNAVGFGFDSRGALWTTSNGQDNLGAQIPEEGLWLAQDGDFMGWPYAYNADGAMRADPNFGDSSPIALGQIALPALEHDAHSAPLGLTFWEGTRWGADFTGDAFIAFHGSHTGSASGGSFVGYEVMRVDFDATGAIRGRSIVIDNLQPNSGSDESQATGRPVDVLQFGNALLFSDDLNGRIYRIDRS